MVFHVASSLKQVEKYVRDHHVMPYSWWKVECRVLDELSDKPETHYFDYRGQPRKSAPHASALRAYEKWQAEDGAAKEES